MLLWDVGELVEAVFGGHFQVLEGDLGNDLRIIRTA